MDFLHNLNIAFRSGGIWMWVIFAVHIATILLVAERAIALFMKQRRGEKREIAQLLEDDIRKGNMQSALMKANSLRGDALAVAARAGIQSAIDMGGREEIQLKMDEVLIEESGRLEERTGFLAMLANVATLLGLLGTIVGMIEAFTGMSQADPATKAEILSRGVSTAMYATAYGLIVAVPALVAYSVLTNRANQLVDELNRAALRIYISLGFHYDSVGSSKRVK